MNCRSRSQKDLTRFNDYGDDESDDDDESDGDDEELNDDVDC